jgi:hypothetical protein
VEETSPVCLSKKLLGKEEEKLVGIGGKVSFHLFQYNIMGFTAFIPA